MEREGGNGEKMRKWRESFSRSVPLTKGTIRRKRRWKGRGRRTS